jgi:hypothetical protein
LGFPSIGTNFLRVDHVDIAVGNTRERITVGPNQGGRERQISVWHFRRARPTNFPMQIKRLAGLQDLINIGLAATAVPKRRRVSAIWPAPLSEGLCEIPPQGLQIATD